MKNDYREYWKYTRDVLLGLLVYIFAIPVLIIWGIFNPRKIWEQIKKEWKEWKEG